MTLIEKFEKHSDVGYAVVLLTPDDKGGMNKEGEPLQNRARQNVIFELGFFFGKLERKRVAAMYRKGVELPTDMEGVVYISLDDGEWKLKLAKELVAAGMPVDTEAAFRS